ncbi:hypothetical protein QPK24_12215 [Paenibacillus polygoni]|uniref:Zinc-binding dehydrogenase n=1 Tax=Paenibacillus polygoni TaxID=3050112 RepID=A0ABY8WY34_9BACL|nr:hypothetical protein [Paenibacillus polygoni]WIV17219.1 hypothetical protein QPK24_12215 [Paenibacillus polygoni]
MEIFLSYSLQEAAQAFEYFGAGHAIGKVIINIKSENEPYHSGLF